MELEAKADKILSADQQTASSTLLSVVIPVFNEEENLLRLVEELRSIQKALSPTAVEVLLVDDGSADRTFELASDVAQTDPSFIAVKLARNFGSHAAIAAGLTLARGDCAVFMAADFQDPPALIPKMLEAWQKDFKIVWAARFDEDSAYASGVFSRLYHHLFNCVVAYPVPNTGVDFALLDRSVLEVLKDRAQITEPIFAQITDTGFPSTVIPYRKAERVAGKSGWTLKKKLDMVALTAAYSLRVFYQLVLIAMACIAAGVFAGVCAAVAIPPASTVLVMFSLLLVGVGFLLQLCALLLFGKYMSVKLTSLHVGSPRFSIAAVTRLNS